MPLGNRVVVADDRVTAQQRLLDALAIMQCWIACTNWGLPVGVASCRRIRSLYRPDWLSSTPKLPARLSRSTSRAGTGETSCRPRTGR